MRIVIDLQGAQTDSRYHGIGRYSREFALALARNPRHHEIWLMLNGAFSEVARELRQTFADVVPADRILTFFPPAPLEPHVLKTRPRRSAAEQIRAHLLRSIEPDCVVVTSLIETPGTDAVTTNADAGLDAITAAVVYDLIPWLQPDVYLGDGTTRQFYETKLGELGLVQLLLAISESSRQEAIDHLPQPAERVVNISCAASSAFSPAPDGDDLDDERRVRIAHGITRRFVMYSPSGYDPRKNIEGLIEAFALLPIEQRSTLQLAITSKFTPQEHERLRTVGRKAGLATDDLVLTGFVSDTDLIALYRATALFVYPSLHEGFGLPALEAMSCGAPVIGSDRTSVPEIIGQAEALFDPTSPTQMADMMSAFLADPGQLAERRIHGLEQAASFSWERTAARALDAIEEVARPGEKDATADSDAKRRGRLALVSPLPPQRTGIAAHVAGLVPALADAFDVTLICEQPTVALTGPGARLPCHDAAWFRAHADEFDHVVYQMGNSEFHTFMLPLVRSIPGVVVLHDFYLGGLFWSAERSGSDPTAWADALRDSHADIAWRVVDEVDLLRGYPANRSILNGARSVVVHSEHAKALIEHWYGSPGSLDIHVVPLARAEYAARGRDAARKALGIAPETLLTCSFGQVDPTKRNADLLRAWLDSESAHDPRAELHLVGPWPSPAYADELVATAARHPHGDRVILTGWTSPETYGAYLEAADVAVQLRAHSRGESSAALLDCLNHGIPTIANEHGSSAELPADAVRFVDDDFTQDGLTKALDELLGDPPAREALGEAARGLMAARYSPAASAAAYAVVLESSAARRRDHSTDLLRGIATTTTDADLLPDVVQSVARSVRPPVTPRQVLIDVTGTPTWPDVAASDALVFGAPSHVRVRFVRVRATPHGPRLMNVDGHSRSGGRRAAAIRYLADLRTGDVLVVTPGQLVDAPELQAVYLDAQAAGVRLAVPVTSAEAVVDVAELLSPGDVGLFCRDPAVAAVAERTAATSGIAVHLVTDKDPREAAVSEILRAAAE